MQRKPRNNPFACYISFTNEKEENARLEGIRRKRRNINQPSGFQDNGGYGGEPAASGLSYNPSSTSSNGVCEDGNLLPKINEPTFRHSLRGIFERTKKFFTNIFGQIQEYVEAHEPIQGVGEIVKKTCKNIRYFIIGLAIGAYEFFRKKHE